MMIIKYSKGQYIQFLFTFGFWCFGMGLGRLAYHYDLLPEFAFVDWITLAGGLAMIGAGMFLARRYIKKGEVDDK